MKLTISGLLFRRRCEVAFVFTVFVVHHHHDPPGAISSSASGTETKGIGFIVAVSDRLSVLAVAPGC